MSVKIASEIEFDETRRSPRRLRRLKRRLRQRPDGELNIVSMIDVFAVLVFFLLVGSSISASKLHALKLSLPAISDKAPDMEKEPLNLAVSLFANYIEISSSEGLHKKLPNIAKAYDTAALAQALADIKRAHLDEERLTLFIAEDIAYADIVAVMDSSREYSDGSAGTDGSRVLFPLISMGDAPVDDAAGSQP